MNDLPTTPGGWDVILADPPWNFSGNSVARPGRNARRHYPCLSLDQICALPVGSVAAADALLLLWITAPFSHHRNQVCAAWGFHPVSELLWVKDRIGLGYWARNRHETLVIARRGKPACPRPALFPDSVITAQQREHSRKPDIVQQTIDQRLGHTARLELFARHARPGWTVWGDEVGQNGEAA